MKAIFSPERTVDLKNMLLKIDNPIERERTVIEEICHALRDIGGKYVLPFCFKNDQGTRTNHHLIFFSKSDKGYEIMKNIMAKESSTADQGVPSFIYCPADKRWPTLFELTRPLDDLEEMLLESFSGKKLNLKQIYLSHNIGKPFIRRNYREALINLHEKNKIDVIVEEGKKWRNQKKEFPEHLTVVFPLKKN